METISTQNLKNLKEMFWYGKMRYNQPEFEAMHYAFEELIAYRKTGIKPEEIEQLKDRTRWIPVAERLPENYQKILVTAYEANDEIYVSNSTFLDGHFYTSGTVTAWMPLPEPYTQEDAKNE